MLSNRSLSELLKGMKRSAVFGTYVRMALTSSSWLFFGTGTPSFP